MASTGLLKVQVLKENTYIPIENAKITIKQTKIDSNITNEQSVNTDSSGLVKGIELEAPPIENSMNPSDKLPYSFCDIKIEVPNYNTLLIKSCQIYPKSEAFQKCNMKKSRMGRQNEEVIEVAPNKLVGNYPSKIPENPNKKLPPPPSGFVVLPEPVVPQYIVVHTGGPNTNAPNYTLGFKDYIKNVASSEIFSTWSEMTIRANVYCIISFTINRIYTEWYRGKGKNFDITSSTAYDHAFSYGRNIYSNISRIVDDIFSTYIKRFNRKQPLLTQYCDGIKVQCPGWLTQWGSKYLGDEGRTPYEILTNFYGTNIELVRAKKVSGIPMSYPGYILQVGSRGTPVRTVQRYLNRISVNYPLIPKQAVDGIYGAKTEDVVSTFQRVFNLPVIGKVDYATWYKISDVYVAVTKIAELRRSSKNKIFIPPYINSNDKIPMTYYSEDL